MKEKRWWIAALAIALALSGSLNVVQEIRYRDLLHVSAAAAIGSHEALRSALRLGVDSCLAAASGETYQVCSPIQKVEEKAEAGSDSAPTLNDLLRLRQAPR